MTTRTIEALRRPFLMAAVVVILLRLLLAAFFPVLREEAHFWEWSKFPALGYDGHPPMVAWVIRVCEQILPNQSAFGLRLGSLVLGFATLALVYHLALRFFRDRRVAEWSLILALCLPLLNATGFLMLPEAPLVFFHLLFLLWLHSALSRGDTRHWVLAGFAMGLALLSQLVALLSLLAAVFFILSSPTHRRWFRRKEPYLALVVAMATLSPFLYWVAQHGEIEFWNLLWERRFAGRGFSLLHVAEVFFEQLVNTGFLLFLPLVGSLFVSARRLPDRIRDPFRLLRIQALTVLVFFFTIGLVVQTHPHWTLLAYPSAALCLAVHFVNDPNRGMNRGMKTLAWASMASVMLVAVAALLAVDLLVTLDPEDFGDSWGRKITLARHRLFGWDELSSRLDGYLHELPGDEPGFLFTHQYDSASRLSFSRSDDIVIDLGSIAGLAPTWHRAQHFYLEPTALVGSSGIFFGDEECCGVEALRKIFEDAERLPPIRLTHKGVAFKELQLFHVQRLRAEALDYHCR